MSLNGFLDDACNCVYFEVKGVDGVDKGGRGFKIESVTEGFTEGFEIYVMEVVLRCQRDAAGG